MKNNYYEILGVTPDSEFADIKSAYRKLARKFHPDVAPDCIEKFKNINEAYETLSNEKKRMQYNMLFGFYKKGGNNSSEKRVNQKCEEQYQSDKKSNKNEAKAEKVNSQAKTKKEAEKNFSSKSEKKNNSKSEKSFFEDLFASSAKSEKLQQQDGADLTVEVSVTIAEVSTGVSKVVNILHTEQCPKCKGRKFINGAYCSECQGTGEKTRQRKLTVKIPAGIKNQTKLRLKGEGNVGKNGGKNGDLFFIVKIEENKNVRYEGQKVYYEVPIEPWEAVLGSSVILKTLEGNIVVKIPAKTKSGQKFRVQQNVGGKVCEIFVTVHIEIPAYLSDDEIKLYEKLKRISSVSARRDFING